MSFKVLIHAKDKELHKVYKGLSHEVVKTTFNWDDNYVKKDLTFIPSSCITNNMS